jgi:hypothetical protein
MPFDTSPKDPKDLNNRLGLKPIKGQPSMFDGKPKPPSQQEFQKDVQETQDKMSGYKRRAAELFMQFTKAINDKTLPQNRNVLNTETEKELLQNFMQLAMDINSDPNEQENMGSLTLITCLFKTCLSQRDRLNELEYSFQNLMKKLDTNVLLDFIVKELAKVAKIEKEKKLANLDKEPREP